MLCYGETLSMRTPSILYTGMVVVERIGGINGTFSVNASCPDIPFVGAELNRNYPMDWVPMQLVLIGVCTTTKALRLLRKSFILWVCRYSNDIAISLDI